MPDRDPATMSAVIDAINAHCNKIEARAADSFEKGLAAIVAGNFRELLGPYADPHYKDPEADSW